jgi:hypothetical protein
VLSAPLVSAATRISADLAKARGLEERREPVPQPGGA